MESKLLGDGCAVASRRALAQFKQKPEQGLGIQQRPSSAGPYPRSGLKNLHVLWGKIPYHCIHILHFEEDVVNAAAVFLQKLTIGVALPFQGLDKFQLQRAKLNESLPDLDVLFFAAEKVLGIRAIRPLNETERSNAEKGSQQSRRLDQIRNDDAYLDCLLQCHPSDRGFFRAHISSSFSDDSITANC